MYVQIDNLTLLYEILSSRSGLNVDSYSFLGGNPTELLKVMKYLQEARGLARIRTGGQSKQDTLPQSDLLISVKSARVAVSAVLDAGARMLELLQADPELEKVLWSSESFESFRSRELAAANSIGSRISALEIEASDLERDVKLKEGEVERMENRLLDLKALCKSDDNPELTIRMRAVYSDYVTKHMNLDFLLFELSRLGLL